MTDEDPPQPERRTELADFLRAHRARIRPAQFGLPARARRRTPGLRREEVAELIGVGVTWYTWLEQGRAIRVSVEVLEALARVLQLSADERAYLFALAQRPLPPAQTSDLAPVSPVLQTMLDALEPYPANLRDDRWYVLAWNRAESLIADWAALPPVQRHVVWNMFTNLPLRQMAVEWSTDARTQLALFRMASRRHAGASWLADLSEHLEHVSPEFRTWWSQHEVQQQRERAIVLQHPRVGRLVLQRMVFTVESNPSLSLRVLLPLPDADTAARLHRLGIDRR
jgi:transcriptional regulator with XRE-family HTH domain